MKARFLAITALILGMVSCQKDTTGFDVVVDGEQETTISVSLPEATRANSAQGFDLTALGSNYDIRYILEIYRVENDEVLYDNCQRFVETSDGTSMVFPVRLAPGYDYRIVAWADIVEDGSEEDRYYYTEEGLDNVVIKDNGTVNWNAMDETRDAYTYVKVVDNFNSSSNLDMILTRPFAKLRVVATDITDILNVSLEPTTATVTYSQDMYFKYNAVADIENKGAANAAKAKSHTFTYENTATKYDDNDGEYTLFSDYIFVPSTGTAKFILNVKDANNHTIKENAFITDIFVERNKLTTIKGDVLTTGGNVTITVDNELGVKETYTFVDTAEDLQTKIKNAEVGKDTNIKLGGDINLGDLFGTSTFSTRAAATLPIVIDEGKVVVLDLNGHTITTPFAEGSITNHTYAFENHGSLTIQDSNGNGNGQIIARGIFNYGTMTLKSGTINACDGNGGYGVRNYEGAEFIMNGGSIVTSYEDGDIPGEGYDASPVRVDEGATATINGGAINNVSNFTVAIDNYGTTTINDGTFTTIHTTIANSASMTINGGSFTCNGLEGVTAHALWAAAGTTTINGGIFNGKDNYNGFNVDADEGAIVNINGGKFLPVHSGSLYGKGTIIVKGGTFFDQIAESRIDSDFKLAKDGENWIVTKKDPIAKIGDVEYTSLAKAVAAVEDGGTITLVAHEVFTETNRYNNGGWWDGLGYSGDKSFTIDLNNYTISQDGALNDYLIWIKNDGSKANTITLKNGTLDAGKTAYCAFATASSNKQKITINLEDVNLVGNNSNGAVAKIRGGSELNVKAGTVITGKNNYVGIEAVGNNTVVNIYEGAEIYQNGTDSYVGAIVGASYNATMNIYGGYGKSAKCGIIVMSTGATINVSGGEWIANNDGTPAGDNNAVLVSQNNRYETGWACKSILNVTGGTFKGGYNCYGMGPGVEPNDAQINIKGGNFNANPVSYVVAGYESVEENGVYTVGMPKALVDFVAAIAEGGNVTLDADITLLESVVIESGKTVVLNLNGKTISGNWHKNNGAIIKNEGTLTIVGGTIASTGENGGSAIANYGTLTIDNATINGAPRKGESWPSYPINNYSNATVTNSVVTGYQGCLALNNAGTTTIENCNFTKNYEKTSSHVFYVNHADAKVIINGGTYNHNGFDGSLAYINKGEVTINAGTFNAKDGGYGVAVLSGGKVTVNGGTLPAFLNWGGQIIDNRTK